jgi:mannose-1-phosphate guanylyltransferase
VGGRSLLEWNLRWLTAAGMGPIWINLHYRPDEVRRAVESMDLPGEEIRFSHEDPILGTAGAWRELAPEWDETTLVVYGDNLTRFDLGAFSAAHRAARVLATVALFDPARHANTGIAGSRVVIGADRRVEGFEETRGGAAGPSLVNTGACLLEPVLAERIAPGYADFGGDVFPALVRDRALAAHVIEDGGFCLGLDTPAHFELGREMVESGKVLT